MVILDTNAVLRYILQDIPEMADEVETYLTEHICYIPTEVVAEIVYVLDKVYHVERSDTSKAIVSVLSIPNVETTNIAVVETGLATFSKTKLDFVDCLMHGYQSSGFEVFTFDKALKKYLAAK